MLTEPAAERDRDGEATPGSERRNPNRALARTQPQGTDRGPAPKLVTGAEHAIYATDRATAPTTAPRPEAAGSVGGGAGAGLPPIGGERHAPPREPPPVRTGGPAGGGRDRRQSECRTSEHVPPRQHQEPTLGRRPGDPKTFKPTPPPHCDAPPRSRRGKKKAAETQTCVTH